MAITRFFATYCHTSKPFFSIPIEALKRYGKGSNSISHSFSIRYVFISSYTLVTRMVTVTVTVRFSASYLREQKSVNYIFIFIYI